MRQADFTSHVRTARNVLYSHLGVPAAQDSDPISRPGTDVDALRRSAPLWLSAWVVEGYEPARFPSLADVVREYGELAGTLGERTPADDELRRGVTLLRRLLAGLNDHIDPEGATLMAAIRSLDRPFPDFFLGVDYNLDTDWTGDPCIRVWVIMVDETDADTAEFQKFWPWFRESVRSAVLNSGTERFPYFRIRVLSDALGLVAEESE